MLSITLSLSCSLTLSLDLYLHYLLISIALSYSFNTLKITLNMPIGRIALDGARFELASGKITTTVVITCIVAASSGLIFGYDIGITGGVTTMRPFLKKFFPSVLRTASETKSNMYCVFDSQALTAFTSSLYIAGLAASLFASRLNATAGRKNTIVLGGCTFLVGASINGTAENITMLILGRILLGFGVGFTNQATPIYLSEVAPPKWRGTFNSGFQFFIAIGVLTANCINYAVAKYNWGWRFSLGFAAFPAILMIFGALLISDTPNSLVGRGRIDEARSSLLKIRGCTTSYVDAELAVIIEANEASKAAHEMPFMTIFEKQYRPHLTMAVAIPFFQQVTGISVIAFYAPALFTTVGFRNDSALITAIIFGIVNLMSVLISSVVVDRFGRRFLFAIGGIQMFICQVTAGCILAYTTAIARTKHMSKGHAIAIVILTCIYAAGFGWSWGPLSWLIPSEIFPMKIRPIGQSISVAIGFATTFVLSQMFLTMLCHFGFGAFLFFGGWIGVMTIFILLLLPEMKGISLEDVRFVWQQHWYWHRFVST